MEKRVANGTIIIEKDTNNELKIIDSIETNNQFSYGVYLYSFKGKPAGFGLYRKEFTIKENN